MSRQILSRKKTKSRKVKAKEIPQILALFLAFMGSNACIFVIQLASNYSFPIMWSFMFQIAYGFVLYYKFKKMNISNNNSNKMKSKL